MQNYNYKNLQAVQIFDHLLLSKLLYALLYCNINNYLQKEFLLQDCWYHNNFEITPKGIKPYITLQSKKLVTKEYLETLIAENDMSKSAKISDKKCIKVVTWKVLTKLPKGDIINKFPHERTSQRLQEQKEIKKSFRKHLTRAKKSDIIKKLLKDTKENVLDKTKNSDEKKYHIMKKSS